jgi:hypothetical protein
MHHGPTCIVWANLTPFSLKSNGCVERGLLYALGFTGARTQAALPFLPAIGRHPTEYLYTRQS